MNPQQASDGLILAMSMEPSEVTSHSELTARYFARLSAGDADAVDSLCQLFYEKLALIARKRFGKFPLRVIDEYAIANDVLLSFHKRAQQGEFPNVQDYSDLMLTLSKLTRDRVVDAIRRHTAIKRGGGQTRGNSIFAPTSDLRNGGFDQFQVDEETPSGKEMAAERVQQLIAKLSRPDLRVIFVLRHEGFTNEEIAEEMDLSIASIERKRRRIREELADECLVDVATK